ncbi:hypothetical protein BDM02DRAFT_2058431 [Thelephora ganbajun]|uniref:Uncharacterized protein n=1 Tax=Thelephora ganbajun TaxID=370292 RepID=A0ACB6ZHB8_THEGA|nr:hypothetical protein BDM02DRAFT_2058431 [Thelephora ganbajun]
MARRKRFSAFFYGTLLHPEILKRVIGNKGSRLKICPAVLLDHTRHKVKHADYPGILPYSKSKFMLGHDLEVEEVEDRSVHGSLVIGLSQADMNCLDVFEGDEYVREKVQVYSLGPIVRLADYEAPKRRIPGPTVEEKPDLTPSTPEPLPPNPSETLKPAIECETYIWASDPKELTEEPWSFRDFIQLNAWKWIPGESEGANDRQDYLEVDRRREMGGNIVRGPPQE